MTVEPRRDDRAAAPGDDQADALRRGGDHVEKQRGAARLGEDRRVVDEFYAAGRWDYARLTLVDAGVDPGLESGAEL